ncbi:MAG: hypothetical protein EPN88_14890 [Bacteroidetes bacterium]|nr:MAG: hypothetical protein EPN88_14890 [Bacteroidota bacterium]
MRQGEDLAISSKHKFSDFLTADYNKKIEIFQTRINDWYFRPINELINDDNNGFPVILLSCTLIDTMSQFQFGAQFDDTKVYLYFLRNNIPEFQQKLKKPIKHTYKNRKIQLTDYAEVFYFGFRCGLIHESRIIHGEIDGSSPNILAWNSNFDILTLNYKKLYDRIILIFNKYISNLKSKNDTDFEKKCSWYFRP